MTRTIKSVLAALIIASGLAFGQQLISGASSNPQTGSATLTSLTVGSIDAGTILVMAAAGTPAITFGTVGSKLCLSAGCLNYINGSGNDWQIFGGVGSVYQMYSGASGIVISPGSGYVDIKGPLADTTGSNTVRVEDSNGLNLVSSTPLLMNSVLVLSSATPTISSGFGTSPSVTAGKAYSFRVNVGTGGTATNGVIALGATATNGWNCDCTDLTTRSDTVFHCLQTADSTTTVTIGNFNTLNAAAAWVASDILKVDCKAF